MNNADFRSLRIGSTMALMGALLLPGCAGSGHVVPPGPIVNGSAAPSTSSRATATFKITIPKATASAQSRSVKYVSPATTQVVIDIQQGGASIGAPYPETVALAPTSTGCSSTLAGTQCQLGVTLAPGSYSFFLTAEDASGTALSAAAGVPFTITPGVANQITVSLGGIPTSVAVVPGAQSALAGSAGSGYSLSRCTSSPQSINVIGVDADTNYILGAGAPTASLTSGGLTVAAAGSTAPNAFTVNVPNSPATAESTSLSANVAYNTGSGVQNVSATIPVTISSDICGQVTTLQTSGDQLYGLAFDASGNLIIATGNHYVDKLTPAGVFSHFAGTGVAGHADESSGTPTTATFNNPRGIAVDRNNNIFVTDTFNDTIRKIDTSGNVTTFAGTAGTSGSHDAQGASATFNFPWGIVADTVGNLYVADASSNKIRKIDSSGNVTTIAGTGVPGSANGSGLSATLNFPTGITIDPFGNLFVVDGGTGNVRKIDTSGNVTTIAAAVSGFALSIAIDPNGTLYVTLTQGPNFNPGIIKVLQSGTFSDIAGGPNGCQSGCNIQDGFGLGASFGAPAGLLVGPGFKLYVADDQQGSVRIVQ